MPRSVWSAKDERQYKAILSSCRKRGRGERECKRIAAATTNKRRKVTKRRGVRGLGSPTAHHLQQARDDLALVDKLITRGMRADSCQRKIDALEDARHVHGRAEAHITSVPASKARQVDQTHNHQGARLEALRDQVLSDCAKGLGRVKRRRKR